MLFTSPIRKAVLAAVEGAISEAEISFKGTKAALEAEKQKLEEELLAKFDELDAKHEADVTAAMQAHVKQVIKAVLGN